MDISNLISIGTMIFGAGLVIAQLRHNVARIMEEHKSLKTEIRKEIDRLYSLTRKENEDIIEKYARLERRLDEAEKDIVALKGLSKG